jgi:hypothetical protein
MALFAGEFVAAFDAFGLQSAGAYRTKRPVLGEIRHGNFHIKMRGCGPLVSSAELCGYFQAGPGGRVVIKLVDCAIA